MKVITATILIVGSLTVASPALAQETGAAFEMPLDLADWTPDIIGQDGLYRFRHAEGTCQITLAQNLGVDAARAAGQTPEDSLDAYIEQLASQIEVSREEAPDIEIPSADGETIAFVSEDVAYSGGDGIDYHNRISAQWLGDVELLIISACASDEWDAGQASIDAFLERLKVRP